MGEAVTLPDPELSNLAEIESAIKEAQGGMNEKEKLASFIVAEVAAVWPCSIFEIISCRMLNFITRMLISMIVYFNLLASPAPLRNTSPSCSQYSRLARTWRALRIYMYCTESC